MQPPRWSGLQDVEATRRDAPRSYSIPRSDQRALLCPGDVVKLVFEADQPSPEGWTAERMWVIVREQVGSGFVGELNNIPSFISDLTCGDLIQFQPKHVCALERSPSGLALPWGLFAKVSPGIAAGTAWPAVATRFNPDATSSSGWIIAEGADADTSASVLVDDLIASYRVLDSILDEPVGTSWRWDADSLEYIQDGYA